MITYIFGAGIALGTLLGYKVGHSVGQYTPQRKLRKIQKVLGDTATKAKEKAGKVATHAREAASQKINEMME